jgi:hypothetical protein
LLRLGLACTWHHLYSVVLLKVKIFELVCKGMYNAAAYMGR